MDWGLFRRSTILYPIGRLSFNQPATHELKPFDYQRLSFTDLAYD